MDSFVSDDRLTRDADLASWNAFCLAYYEPIRRAFKLMRVSENEVDDLAHSFVVKAAERNFLETYRAFQAKEAREKRKTKFRRYLYRSLQHHVHDYYNQRGSSGRTISLDPEAAGAIPAAPDPALDPDALLCLMYCTRRSRRCGVTVSGPGSPTSGRSSRRLCWPASSAAAPARPAPSC